MSDWTPERHAEAKALCDAATEGPWQYECYGSGSRCVGTSKANDYYYGSPRPGSDGILRSFVANLMTLCDCHPSEDMHWVSASHDEQERHDLNFIARSRELLPAALAEIERLASENTEVRTWLIARIRALETELDGCSPEGSLDAASFSCLVTLCRKLDVEFDTKYSPLSKNTSEIERLRDATINEQANTTQTLRLLADAQMEIERLQKEAKHD